MRRKGRDISRGEKMEFEMYEVGVTKIDHFANMGDGFFLDWNNESGFFLYSIFNNPSAKEIKSVSTGGEEIEIAFTEMQGVGFLCIKFQSLFWSDCVFEPRLYEEKPKFPKLAKEKGLGLYIVMIDPSKGGLVVGMRAIGLGHDFSEKLIAWCDEKCNYPFAKDKYIKNIESVQTMYSSTQLAKKALFRYSVSANSGSGNERNAINREYGR